LRQIGMQLHTSTVARLSLGAALIVLAGGEAQRMAAADQGSIDRGKYLVENVVMCWRCHTPQTENGDYDRSQWLLGAPIRKQPTYNEPNWALRSPRIAGSPPGTDDQIITLLTTGIARTGRPPNPPMPRFHMTRMDAEAVLAYLKSLPR
jgi:mono/diheme cytochrome c family protein